MLVLQHLRNKASDRKMLPVQPHQLGGAACGHVAVRERIDGLDTNRHIYKIHGKQ